MTEMPPDMLAAIQFCVGKPLSPWFCRRHFPTGLYDPETGHGGLDCVCDRRKNHTNRGRCWRCGREYPKGEN